MTMKQTQTKMFDFADTGLDFSPGSKNLFPDRFKKMLALGYNIQTVSNVTVAGNQVTFTYGGAHGYAVGRVLKVNLGTLASINDGEFVIDSITTNTVTLTIDAAPLSIAAGFTTHVASLGYELVYEQANIHVYKFKALDESSLYLRLCFQNQSARRNCISPCIGKSYNPNTGFINDINALAENKELLTPGNGFKWEFSFFDGVAYDDWVFSQGFSTFGKGCIIGSKYHLFSLHSNASEQGRIVGFAPTQSFNYEVLAYPVLIGESYANMTGFGGNYQGENGRAYLGNIRVVFDVNAANNDSALFTMPQANSSFLSNAIDTFNTTTASPIMLYEQSTKQFLGFLNGGVYVCKYATTNMPPVASSASPSVTYDTDLNHQCLLHFFNAAPNTSYYIHLVFPVERINHD